MIKLACRKALLIVAAVALGATTRVLAAQDVPQQGLAPGGPGLVWSGGGPRMHFLGFEAMGEGKVVKGAPYSAQAVTERIQVLPDGNRIDQKTTAQVYRDGAGRTRRETTLGPIGPWGAPDNATPMVLIKDPVAGVGYVLNPGNHTAVKRTLAVRAGQANRSWRREQRAAGQASANNVTTESLGKQMLQGIEAEGTRTTVTIPAGAMGNAQAIQIVSERWYSPALGVVVMSTRSDPRLGETTYQLTNVNLAEPAASLFQVSSDYTVTERSRTARHAPPPDTN